jgi:hypothetical protein
MANRREEEVELARARDGLFNQFSDQGFDVAIAPR